MVIGECLGALAFCKEIVILDGGSTDDTVTIARAHGARVAVSKEWFGFGPQKQMALEMATSDWVFLIDADEIVSPELATEIATSLKQNLNIAFAVERSNYFLGKHLRFGGWGRDVVTRISKRHQCAVSPDIVHERLLVDVPVRRLRGELIHYSYRDALDVLNKQVLYAKLGARRLSGRKKKFPWPILRSFATFVKLYLVQLGFLDGRYGFIAALVKAYETFWRYFLHIESKKI